MDIRKMATAVAIIALVTVLVPMTMDEGDALSSSDIGVSIPGYDVRTEASANGNMDLHFSANVGNGNSTDITVYLINYTDDYINVTTSGDGTGVVTTAATTDRNLIGPSSDGEFICTVTVTLTADIYADNQTVPTETRIVATDITDPMGARTITFTLIIDAVVESSLSSDDSYNKFFGIIPNNLGEPLDSAWFTALVTLALWILGTVVVSYVAIPLFTKLVGVRKTQQEKDKLKIALTETITLMMFIIAINECVEILGASPELCSAVATASRVLYVVIGAIIVWQLYLFIMTALINGIDESTDLDGLDNSLIPLFKMIGKLLIAVTAVAAIMAAFGVDLAGILVSAGVISLGITLGAQETLNQFFSGVVLLATRPFRKGDFVRIDGEVYTVRKVKLMFTEFNNWDNDQIITMPNNKVSSSMIVNLTRDSKDTRVFIYMSVAYDSDLSLVKELMVRAANMHPHVITDGTRPMPTTRLTNFLDSGIEYRLACYVDDFDNNSHYAGQIREIIFKLFKDNDVEIPYNRLEIDILDPCDGKKKDSDKTMD